MSRRHAFRTGVGPIPVQSLCPAEVSELHHTLTRTVETSAHQGVLAVATSKQSATHTHLRSEQQMMRMDRSMHHALLVNECERSDDIGAKHPNGVRGKCA